MITNRIRKYFEQPRRAARARKAAPIPQGFAALPPQLLPASQPAVDQYAQLYRSAYEQALRQSQHNPR